MFVNRSSLELRPLAEADVPELLRIHRTPEVVRWWGEPHASFPWDEPEATRLTIVAILIPRFELAVAAGGREALMGEPAALAPEPGSEQRLGEVSAAAEAFGVRPGMRLGEALSRCPRLLLVPPDPAGVAEEWERVLVRLEAVGAAVESERPGGACFDARGLRRLHGGSLDRVLAA